MVDWVRGEATLQEKTLSEGEARERTAHCLHAEAPCRQLHHSLSRRLTARSQGRGDRPVCPRPEQKRRSSSSFGWKEGQRIASRCLPSSLSCSTSFGTLPFMAVLSDTRHPCGIVARVLVLPPPTLCLACLGSLSWGFYAATAGDWSTYLVSKPALIFYCCHYSIY